MTNKGVVQMLTNLLISGMMFMTMSSADNAFKISTDFKASQVEVEVIQITDSARASQQFLAEVEQQIFNDVNKEREKQGLKPYTYSQQLQDYARDKSYDMGQKGYFSHEDKKGKLMSDQIKQDDLTFKSWGENIAYVSGTTDPTKLATEFMKVWMNSEGHRDNILSTNFKEIGIGVYEKDGKVFATQEFWEK